MTKEKNTNLDMQIQRQKTCRQLDKINTCKHTYAEKRIQKYYSLIKTHKNNTYTHTFTFYVENKHKIKAIFPPTVDGSQGIPISNKNNRKRSLKTELWLTTYSSEEMLSGHTHRRDPLETYAADDA